MPCDSSHLEPSRREIELRLANACLAEIERGKPLSEAEINRRFGCYGKGDLDAETKKLCAACEKLGPKIQKMSLELQMWWRDHQKADKERIASEKAEAKKKKLAAKALAKLTTAERKAIGK